MTFDRQCFQAEVSALWGAADPAPELLALAARGVTGSPHLLIDGELTASASGARFPNVNPATERSMGTTFDAGAIDMDHAVGAPTTCAR